MKHATSAVKPVVAARPKKPSPVSTPKIASVVLHEHSTACRNIKSDTSDWRIAFHRQNDYVWSSYHNPRRRRRGVSKAVLGLCVKKSFIIFFLVSTVFLEKHTPRRLYRNRGKEKNPKVGLSSNKKKTQVSREETFCVLFHFASTQEAARVEMSAMLLLSSKMTPFVSIPPVIGTWSFSKYWGQTRASGIVGWVIPFPFPIFFDIGPDKCKKVLRHRKCTSWNTASVEKKIL